MEDTFKKYIFTSKAKNTYKLSSSGYTYSRRKIVKDTEYYYCDQRKICTASYVFRDNLWKKGKQGWENEYHAAHPPNFGRSLVQETIGKMKELAIDSELTTTDIISKTAGDLPLSSQSYFKHDDACGLF